MFQSGHFVIVWPQCVMHVPMGISKKVGIWFEINCNSFTQQFFINLYCWGNQFLICSSVKFQQRELKQLNCIYVRPFLCVSFGSVGVPHISGFSYTSHRKSVYTQWPLPLQLHLTPNQPVGAVPRKPPCWAKAQVSSKVQWDGDKFLFLHTCRWKRNKTDMAEELSDDYCDGLK